MIKCAVIGLGAISEHILKDTWLRKLVAALLPYQI